VFNLLRGDVHWDVVGIKLLLRLYNHPTSQGWLFFALFILIRAMLRYGISYTPRNSPRGAAFLLNVLPHISHRDQNYLNGLRMSFLGNKMTPSCINFHFLSTSAPTCSGHNKVDDHLVPLAACGSVNDTISPNSQWVDT